jgi:hypothetical protein
MIGLFLYSCEKEEEPKIYTNLGEMLKDIDEECAYQIYLKDSVDLKKWIDTLTVDSKYDLNSRYYFDVLLVALHETNHMINARLSGVNTEIYITCNGTYGRNSVGYATPDNYNFTLFSYGNIFVTGLDYKSNIIETNIISETIPHKNFKNDYIYKFYIENNGKPQNLLDEWNSFNVQDNYFIKYNDFIKYPNLMGRYGNTIKFMLYLQCYLKSARLNYQYTYDQIKNNSELIELIQFLWLKSEETLDNGFDLINLNKQYFEYIYSDDFLQELDSLGIQHQNMKHWKKTYMNEKYPNYF